MNLIYNNNKKKWTHEPKPKKHTHTHTHTHSFFTYLLTDKLGCSQVALNLNHLLTKSVAAAALKVGTMTRVIISGGGRGERERERECCMCREYLVVVVVVMRRIITGVGRRSCCCCCCCCSRAIDKQKKEKIFTLKVFEMMSHGTLKFQIAFWALKPTFTKELLSWQTHFGRHK